MKKNIFNLYITITSFLFVIAFFYGCAANVANQSSGAYYTGEYKNLFVDLLKLDEASVNEKIKKIFDLYFYGSDSTQRLYYTVEPDMAYFEDVLHNDVRSEGMSYGMMIAVQLDKKEEFDRLWKWAKTYMQHKSGANKNYFAWQLNTDGSIIDSTSASDGEEWIVMSLLFASARWGNGEGIFNYKNEAQSILDAMLHQEEQPENDGVMTNMFNKENKMVVFVPEIQASHFTDPSYHLPHYYELWGRWAERDNEFWCEAATVSRRFLKSTAHPVTGLSPDYAQFDGRGYNPWGGGNDNFMYDARRVAMNVAVDYLWFARDDWAVTQSNNLLNFFYTQGIGKYGALFTLDGKMIDTSHSAGLVGMNAVAALASTNENKKEFVEELWNTPAPEGLYRYYDGALYFLAMLQVSGNFKIYKLPEGVNPDCN